MTTHHAQRMSIEQLAVACRTEADEFRGSQSCPRGYCFELIRRAVCDRDDAAWAAVIAQYRGLVLSWVRQHPASASVSADDSYWVTRAFERFWMAVGPERFTHFHGLAQVAQYLKLCVHSVLLDEVRSRGGLSTEPLSDDDEAVGQTPDVAEQVVSRMAGQELWRAIERALPDEPGRLAIYLSFGLDLKPREVQRRFPETFPDVADVYRAKRSALERLRRSADLRAELAEAVAGRG